MILCPSVFDALTFWSHGYRNVTCTFGRDALTADHLTAFTEFKIKRVLVVDLSVVQKLLDAGLDVYSLQLPPTLSINVYAQQAGDPAEALGALIRNAHWLGKGQAVPVTTQPVKMIPTSLPTPVLIEPAVESPSTTDSGQRLAAKEQEEEDPLPLSETAISPPSSPPSAVRSASPLPPAPAGIEAEVGEDEVKLTCGDRQYRVRGWSRNLSFDVLRVNVLVSNSVGLFVDTFDLYSAKHRRAFIVQAAQELQVEERVVKHDVGRLLLKLEELLDRHITEAMQPKETSPSMTDEEKAEALRLLHDPHLLDRIVSDFSIVGEASNKLVGYLAAVSRKLDDPLAIIIQSSTAAGKSSLMDAVLAFVPPEDVVQFSRHDRAGVVLHGRERSEAQDSGGRGGGGCSQGQLRPEAPAKRRPSDHRQHRQGSQHRTAVDPDLQGRRSGHALPHDHDQRAGR